MTVRDTAFRFRVGQGHCSLLAGASLALLSGFLPLAGAPAWAGSCAPGGTPPVTHVCSGAANPSTDTQQTLSGSSLNVETSPGFGIDTTSSGGSALSLQVSWGGSDLVFSDYNASYIAGQQNGIYARSYGSGELSIFTSGSVSGVYGNGIYAFNGWVGTNLHITATGSVSGGLHGIYAGNNGLGEVSVSTSGAVLGMRGNGISIYNGWGGTSLSLSSSGDVTGYFGGLYATNYGSGDMTISSSGRVVGNSTYGIRALNGWGGGDLSIFAFGEVRGHTDGISSVNFAQGGNTTIITSSSVNGVTGAGIRVSDGFGNGSMVIASSGEVNGYQEGISAFHFGSGNMSISTYDVVSGIIGDGIRAGNYGRGDLSVSTFGPVSSMSRNGIFAFNSWGGGNLSVYSRGDVDGYTEGILAIGYGRGDVRIETYGEVTGISGNGIRAANYWLGRNLSILSYGNVFGYKDGISASKYGQGNLSAISFGSVSGSTGNGISAANYGAGNALIYNAGSVVGGGGSGIRAINGWGARSLAIVSSGSVSGYQDGIFSSNFGSGSATINNSGYVYGSTGNGILARNFWGSNGLSILSSGDVYGRKDGISAWNYGVGDVDILNLGTVRGSQGDGISIQGFGSRRAATVTVDGGGYVRGGNVGIFGWSNGGDFTVNVLDGHVLGDSGLAINDASRFGASANTTVNLGAAGLVTGSIIVDGAPGSPTNSKINLYAGGEVELFDPDGAGGSDPHLLVLRADAINNDGTIDLSDGHIDANSSIAYSGSNYTSYGWSSPVSPYTAVVDGSYSGTGGVIRIDVDGNADQSDTVHFWGATSGTTYVIVNDRTLGSGSGGSDILVFQVDGGSELDGDDFVLPGGWAAVGAWRYGLDMRAGISSLGGTPGSGPGNSWWLTRLGYSAFASGAEALGFHLLDPMLRFGDRTRCWMGNYTLCQDEKEGPGWAFVETEIHRWSRWGATTAEPITRRTTRLRLGGDFTLAESGGRYWILGLSGGYDRIASEVGSAALHSRLATDRFILGVTASMVTSENFYLDLQGRISWQNTTITSSDPGSTPVRYASGFGYGLSVEVGQTFSWEGNLKVTPQAQLWWRKEHVSTFSGTSGQTVVPFPYENIVGRIGIEISGAVSEGNNAQREGHILLNILREFNEETTTVVSGTPLSRRFAPWTGEIGIGWKHAWARRGEYGNQVNHEIEFDVRAGADLDHLDNNTYLKAKIRYEVRF